MLDKLIDFIIEVIDLFRFWQVFGVFQEYRNVTENALT